VKVLLLQPPQIHTSKHGVSSFPLGLGYIAANLVKEGFQVSILDCFLEKRKRSFHLRNGLYRIGLSDKEISQRIQEFHPDAIGISIAFSRQFQAAVNLALLVRHMYPQIPIVAGGAHVSAAPESLQESEFDYLIVGEGEKAFPELLYHLGRSNGFDPDLPGVFYRDQNRNLTPALPSRFISDLDSLHFPAYELIPLKKAWRKRVPYANILATRGCPHNCNFCSIHFTMGTSIRRRSIQNIIDEITLLHRKYGVKEIFFEDDNLTSNINWAKQLFYSISQLHLDIEIGVRNGIRADKIDKELLELMKEAGCSRVSFAPESGSQRTLDNIIGKRLKLENVEEAVVLARSVGLMITCFFVIGLPGETKKDFQETIAFARKLRRLGCDSIDINCATPYPGTRLYSECMSKGYINQKLDYSQLHTGTSVISTPDFTANDVRSIRLEAMKELKESFSAKIKRGILCFIRQPISFLKKKIRRYFYGMF